MPAASRRTAAPTPLPAKKIAVLGLILAANNSSIWMIFSFLPFMVSDFYPDLNMKELGYRAGFLGSAFSLGSFCGNFMWGLAADRYGRRPALLGGLVGTVISATLFGFSPTFLVALLARFLWGFLNGNIGVSKTYIAEILDESNSHVGMSVFGVVGGIGRTIGPVIGGFLSTPAAQYPVFKGTVFDTFPFALPSLTVAVSCIVVFGLAYVELQETLHFRVKKGSGRAKKGGGEDGTPASPRTAQSQRRSRALTSVQYSQISTADEEEADSPTSAASSSTSSSSSSSRFHSKRRGTIAAAAKEVFGFDRLEVPPAAPTAPTGGAVEPKRLFDVESTTSPVDCEASLSGAPSDPYYGHVADGGGGAGARPGAGYKSGAVVREGRITSSGDVTMSPMSPLREAADEGSDDGALIRAGDDLDGSFEDVHLGTGGGSTGGTGTRGDTGASRGVGAGGADGDVLLRRMWADRPVPADGCGKRPGAATAGAAKTALRKPAPRGSGSGLRLQTSAAGGGGGSADDLRALKDAAVAATPAKKRISFSSIVMVKVIGSTSLGIGQLKHLRPDDQPVAAHDDGADENDRLTADGGGDGDGERAASSRPPSSSVTRYSNGAEFNASLVAQRGTIRQRVGYLLSKRAVLVSTLMYGLNGFVQVISSEIFPLWVVTAKADGGLGFSSNNIGSAIMAAGVVTILLQLFVYPAVVKTAGLVRTYRYGCHLFAVVVVVMPLISALNTGGGGGEESLFTFFLVVSALTLMGTATMFTLISVFVLINNSCYSHERATVNGIGQTFAALGRLTGPYLGSVVFAWSENNGQLWPFNYFFVWYLLAIVAVINARISVLLPRSIERRRREPREPRYASTPGQNDDDYESDETDELIDEEGEEEEDDEEDEAEGRAKAGGAKAGGAKAGGAKAGGAGEGQQHGSPGHEATPNPLHTARHGRAPSSSTADGDVELGLVASK